MFTAGRAPRPFRQFTRPWRRRRPARLASPPTSLGAPHPQDHVSGRRHDGQRRLRWLQVRGDQVQEKPVRKIPCFLPLLVLPLFILFRFSLLPSLPPPPFVTSFLFSLIFVCIFSFVPLLSCSFSLIFLFYIFHFNLPFFLFIAKTQTLSPLPPLIHFLLFYFSSSFYLPTPSSHLFLSLSLFFPLLYFLSIFSSFFFLIIFRSLLIFFLYAFSSTSQCSFPSSLFFYPCLFFFYFTFSYFYHLFFYSLSPPMLILFVSILLSFYCFLSLSLAFSFSSSLSLILFFRFISPHLISFFSSLLLFFLPFSSLVPFSPLYSFSFLLPLSLLYFFL